MIISIPPDAFADNCGIGGDRLSLAVNDAFEQVATGMEPRRGSGWTYFKDGQYTTGAPLAIDAGVRTKLTINGGAVANTARMEDSVSGWSTVNSTFTGETVGETFLIRLGMTARTTGDAFPDIVGLIGALPVPVLKTAMARENFARVEFDFGAILLPGDLRVPFTGDARLNALFMITTTSPVTAGSIYLTPRYAIEVFDLDITSQRIYRPAP